MRFFFLGAVASALAAVAAAVPLEGNLTPDDSRHMKESIISFTKALDTKSCDAAKAQVMCLNNLIHDRAIQGHVEGSKDEVKYVTMQDGDKIIKDLWKIRFDHEHKGRDEEGSWSQKPKGGKGKVGKGKGGKGAKGKGPGRAKGRPKSGKGKGKGKGGKGKGGRSLDEEEAMRPGKLSCGSAHKILKVIRETAPKTVKFGTTTDDKCAYFINAKEERALKSKVRRAIMFGR